jgi:protein gp37
MSDQSLIEWTDATWNTVRGCWKISPGCEHCYAIRTAARFSGPGLAYEGLTKTDPLNWSGKVRLVPELLDMPLHWHRPRRIFVNSMSDLFHEDVPVDFIADIFGIMFLADWHTYQILTKRSKRMRDLLCGPNFMNRVIFNLGKRLSRLHESYKQAQILRELDKFNNRPDDWWPLKNVEIGVSVENQKYADLRLPDLALTPAATRFVSFEPLLGPVDASRWLHRIDGVIVGGESGPDARPMHPGWVRSLRDQCAPGRAFFFKQWGAWVPVDQVDEITAGRPPRFVHRIDLKGLDVTDHPDLWHYSNAEMVHLSKKKAGRLLDGREWNELPHVAAMPMTADSSVGK